METELLKHCFLLSYGHDRRIVPGGRLGATIVAANPSYLTALAGMLEGVLIATAMPKKPN